MLHRLDVIDACADHVHHSDCSSRSSTTAKSGGRSRSTCSPRSSSNVSPCRPPTRVNACCMLLTTFPKRSPRSPRDSVPSGPCPPRTLASSRSSSRFALSLLCSSRPPLTLLPTTALDLAAKKSHPAFPSPRTFSPYTAPQLSWPPGVLSFSFPSFPLPYIACASVSQLPNTSLNGHLEPQPLFGLSLRERWAVLRVASLCTRRGRFRCPSSDRCFVFKHLGSMQATSASRSWGASDASFERSRTSFGADWPKGYGDQAYYTLP